MKLAMVGLGRMGGNMAERLRRRGHTVVGYDRSGAGDVQSLEDLVAALEPPRAVWIMVPAGGPTESTVEALAGLLQPGDVVVDGGNANFNDSVRRGRALAERGIGFVDAGVSGGVWGLENGYCLMVGGEERDVAVLRPAFEALAPPGGFAHLGPNGCGHFTKMVHNGIEYGMMQAYAEGYELMAASDLKIDTAAAFEVWRYGSVVRSWLLDLMSAALVADPGLHHLRGVAADSGEGRWSVTEAVRLGVPMPVISAALFARFTSQQDDSPAMKVIAALRQQFGGHAVEKTP